MDASSNPARLTARPTSLLLLLALLVAAVFSPSAERAAAAATPAKPADSFVESIGVNTHTAYTDTAYGSGFEQVKQRLSELGVRHIREVLVPERPDQYQRLNELAGMGIRSTLVLGSPVDGSEGLSELVSTASTQLGGSIDAVEGPNEYDSSGEPGWAPRLAEYQQQLYADVKGNPALSGLPVIGPSIVQRSNQESIGDISGSLDYGNIHPYPGGEPPESNIESQLGRAALNSGGKPVVATESGYHTAIHSTEEHAPVSETAMAVYMPRLFLSYFESGVARTFAYELVDEKPNPGLDEPESNFGLLKNDFSEKPAFVALRNLIAILEDPGPAFAPSSLAYSVGGDTSDLHRVLLQKRDGSFYLALWRASSAWDVGQQAPVTAAAEPVELELPAQTERVDRYLPNRSPAPVDSPKPSPGQPLRVAVGPEVVILRVQLGAAPLGRIHVWVPRHTVRAGARVAVHGRLPGSPQRSLRVRIQRWHHGWRTVGHTRTTRSGIFRKKIRVPAHPDLRTPRLRVVAPLAKPSRPVRLHIRRH
ncbi:MAG TPA: hypothetical protein VFS64_10325 [Solirubrobacterales bacterium]|nr:hypothetical protein [Solirubrobacterales bacterium]